MITAENNKRIGGLFSQHVCLISPLLEMES